MSNSCLLSGQACNRHLCGSLKDLKKVESVAKALQGENVSLLDVRVWFNGYISIKLHYARLGSRTEIMHSPDFDEECARGLVVMQAD
ncbi:hypothetical protein GQ600_4416 [Phytophthora cactorum]|nr:hypothetical protein GQ600_4416 [Phytophthora cactorum]